MNFGYLTTFQSLDKGLIERVGPTGFTVSTFNLAFNYTSINSGVVYHVAMFFIAFAALFMVFFIFGTFGLLSLFSPSFVILLISFVLITLSDY